jgi:DNA repair exonuclease SbcCD ATPase subunit
MEYTMHLTPAERSQLLWISGRPTEDADDLDNALAEIEQLEQEVEALKNQVVDLKNWEDGTKLVEFDELKADHETLSAKHEQCKQQLRKAIDALYGDQCKTIAGRRNLARTLQTFLIGQ